MYEAAAKSHSDLLYAAGRRWGAVLKEDLIQRGATNTKEALHLTEIVYQEHHQGEAGRLIVEDDGETAVRITNTGPHPMRLVAGAYQAIATTFSERHAEFSISEAERVIRVYLRGRARHSGLVVRRRSTVSELETDPVFDLAWEIQAVLQVASAGDYSQRCPVSMNVSFMEAWNDVLVMPIIGIIDEERGESLLENMLSAVAGRSARYVILDLTGVESIDTAAAGLLLRVVRAGKLVGAHCVLTGVHPDTAMTLTRLGVDLGDLRTLRTVKDGLRHCLHELGAKSV